jgi:hypothetical protein
VVSVVEPSAKSDHRDGAMSTSAIRSFPALQSAADVPNKPLPAPAGEWGIRGYGIERPIREIPAGALDGGYVSIPVSTDASTLLP